MQAAFILGGCLVIKAIYMVTVNLLARGKVKKQCLTFGDVIVASATDPELRIKGECMVNAAESYRRYISPYLLACIRLPANTSTPVGKPLTPATSTVQPTLRRRVMRSDIVKIARSSMSWINSFLLFNLPL
jgi:hypothetical protein